MSITTSLDAATAAVNALLAQLKISNARLVQVQDTGTADNIVLTPTPAVSAYGPDLVLIVDVAYPNATQTPKLNCSALGQVTITNSDGTPPKIGAVSGKCLFGFATVSGGGYGARLLHAAPEGLSFRVQTYSTPATVALTGADCGRLTNFNQSVTAVELPPVSSVPPGSTLTLINSTPGNNITLSAAAGDSIFIGQTFYSSIDFAYTEDVILYATNSAAADDTSGPRWSALTGSAHERYASQFASSISSPTTGYKKIPDANSPTGFLIEQWGQTVVSASNTIQDVTLPVAFPTAALHFIGSSISVNSAGGAVGVSLSQIGVFANNVGATIAWRALGY